MKPSILAINLASLASALAFAPSPIIQQSTIPSSQTALQATSSRRQLLQNTFSSAATAGAFLAFPSATNALDAASYATAIERSTNALSDSLGHAIIAIDGLNKQAGRLGSSPHPAHPIAVLDGMNAQARRLTRDLDRSAALLAEINSQANEITIADESYRMIVGDVAHAASVLDGLVAQSKRLVGASSQGGSVGSTDDQIIYMLSVLDGLNAQVRRLDMGETFGVLDELNAKAARALL